MPKEEGLRKKLLDEAHKSRYSSHPGEVRMYQDLKKRFWWNGMKQEISQYISRCLVCQKVKIDHKKSAGLLQPLPVPE